MSTIVNLETVCAECGMKLVSWASGKEQVAICENLINKALGILVENGFYAMGVYLTSRKDKEKDGAKHILRELMTMLSENPVKLMKSGFAGKVEADLDVIREVTENLPRLMLARRLAENALTFGRYHCKAIKN